MFEIVFAAMIASIGGTGAVQAQSSPAREPVAADSGPKTLLEGILGSTEKDKGKEGSDGEEHLDADRPHFPEATTTVGKGRAILESGDTFTKKGDSFLSHTAPEALRRVGALADWLEGRNTTDNRHPRQTVDGVTTTANGAKDLYPGGEARADGAKRMAAGDGGDSPDDRDDRQRGGDRRQDTPRSERGLRLGGDQGRFQYRVAHREQFRAR